MNICCEILGWKSLDIEFLEKLINNLIKYTDYDLSDVIDELKYKEVDINDVNSFIYTILYLNEQAIKDTCIEYFPNLKNKINELESDVYCNYIDSGYNSNFLLLDWEEFKISDKKQYVKDFLRNFNLELQYECKRIN